jgi:NADPH:quinone reductase-like Zn-dependent oxidoreductase
MKALSFERNGEPSEVLHLRELPRPQIGPEDVLIRMRLSPVHPSDLHVLRARFGRQPALPATGGSEGVGTIEAMGDAVRGLSVGTRVVLLNVPGTWQELLVCPAARAIPVPDGVSDEDAAQAMVNPLTAWLMTMEEHKLRPGDWLVQTAAGSVVGQLVLQLAKSQDFRTINLVRRQTQVAEITALGGDVVICTDEPDWAVKLIEATGGKGIAKAIDCVAGRVGATIARSLMPGGRMLVYGALSSHRQTDPAAFEMPIFAPRLIYSAAQIQGWFLYQWFAQKELREAAVAQESILKLMASGSMKLPACVKYPIGRLQDALKATDGVNRDGKPLLDLATI